MSKPQYKCPNGCNPEYFIGTKHYSQGIQLAPNGLDVLGIVSDINFSHIDEYVECPICGDEAYWVYNCDPALVIAPDEPPDINLPFNSPFEVE